MEHIEADAAHAYRFVDAKLNDGHIVVGAFAAQHPAAVATAKEIKVNSHESFIIYINIIIIFCKNIQTKIALILYAIDDDRY